MITSVPASDHRLLCRYAHERDEAAFEELVRRHGGMARAVCRRVVGPGGDADDAAQTAFVSLAKHAASLADQLGPSGSLAGWLYRVAVNAGLQQRRATRSRKRREAAVVRGRPPAAEAVRAHVEHSELMLVLDEELKELPACYRTPLVLCHLEGKTQHEAAETLGLSYGTLRRRLDRGRRMLRTRIGRRGVSVGAGLLAALLKPAAARADAGDGFAVDVAALVSGAPSGPVAVVRPRVATAGRSARPAPISAPISATVYSVLLALLLTTVAIPPVVSLLAAAVEIAPVNESGPSPYPGPAGSLNRSTV